MTDKERILKAIKQKQQDVWPTDTGKMAPASVPNNLEQGWLNALTWMEKYINSLPAEQPGEELEEAFDEVLPNPNWYISNDGEDAYNVKQMEEMFCAGAQWQNQQMMKSAIDAKIVNDEMSGCVVNCEQGCLVLEPHTYPIGRKLKILIMEDEQCSTE